MFDATLASLEDTIWDFIEKGEAPTFFIHGKSLLIQEAFLHLATITHPLFGRAVFRYEKDSEEAFAGVLARLEPAKGLGLIWFEVAPLEKETVRDAILITDEPLNPKEELSPKATFLLSGQADAEEDAEEDATYRATCAFLSLHGKPFDEFVLPKAPYPDQPRDWHYLGPSKDLRAFDVLEDELLRGLAKPDGSLCPKESHETIRKALCGEEVSGKEFYGALRACYSAPCLLRDMASYEHDTWLLRTLAFHPDPKRKASMVLPYPLLLARELPRLEGKTDEEAFPLDILYSDFLVPLLYLRELISSLA